MNAVAALRSTPPKGVAWLRANLFGSPWQSVLTLVVLVLAGIAVERAVAWLIIDASWRGDSPAACRGATGACWPFIKVRLGQLFYGLYPVSERWRVDVGLLGTLGVIVAVVGSRGRLRQVMALLLLFVVPPAAIILFRGGVGGLAVVATSQWGGFFLTLVVSGFVLAVSLPTGVLLALGRNSSLPLLRTVCAAWIEWWRAVPVLVLLFVVIIMFPLFMPHGVEVDKLTRALVALSVVMSCYIAEAVRGALLGLARGQYEAAAALGLGYWRTTGLVILPQALKTATPQITSTFIGLFKETTLLLVIGFSDLLGMVFVAASDPQWLDVDALTTGFVFVGLFFWIWCFALSRVSAGLERRLARSQQPRA